MVTSNKMPDKRVVKMSEQNNAPVVPQRTLLGEVNEHITCPLCRGYYIDATTIVECLHSFCRSCIIKHLQVKSYCPQCEMMINSAKPNIKPDKALQDIVYKLVPGLFQKEMERRQQFYSSRPGPAANATPEQRGEDTERIIFSPEDVISFSLEYIDAADTDSISSKSSDSNEAQPATSITRRFLQCPAVVNISHLKKFLGMKFDIDSTLFAIDILYKRVSLQDYYTLMDIAYIYNWKRNEPMRFFYQIIDYVAIRSRLFDNNKKSLEDRKCSPTSIENNNSPAQNVTDQASEISSGTNSPMLEDNGTKSVNETSNNNEKVQLNKDITQMKSSSSSPVLKKCDEDVEKSQFLNSFELTAKNSALAKTSPVKATVSDPSNIPNNNTTVNKNFNNSNKVDDNTLKRKNQTPLNTSEVKKIKIEIEKSPLSSCPSPKSGSAESSKNFKVTEKSNEVTKTKQNSQGLTKTSIGTVFAKEVTQQLATNKLPQQDSSGVKRPILSQNVLSPKRKSVNDSTNLSTSSSQKPLTSLKLPVMKIDPHTSKCKSSDIQKPNVKKMPELKPGIPTAQSSQHKPITKVRMDLLANNSDPTIDRSKILSQVKTSLSAPNSGQQSSGDPLKSLFDSCKINIPSSLSITLTDQKLESRVSEPTTAEQNKNVGNKNLASASNAAHKVPSPPVHNYIEILKLPDTDPKKQQCKLDVSNDTKNNSTKNDSILTPPKPPNKTSETSAKGPVPNLKPISDTKLAKQGQGSNIATPITFQQTFEQQVQSMQCDKKSKQPKNKTQVPKLVPATPKTLNVASKLSTNNKPMTSAISTAESKSGSVLDLSTPHNTQSQLGPQQTKALETMQSIANLAKKQTMPSKGISSTVTQNSVFNASSRPLACPLRIPTTSNINQIKLDKINSSGSSATNSLRQDILSKSNQLKQSNNSMMAASSPVYPTPMQNPSNTTQPSPRPQTRSPSSSPKLVIAEDKQNTSLDHNLNQSNQISSTQVTNPQMHKMDSPKVAPGPSKSSLKPMKPLPTTSKMTGMQQPILPSNSMSNPNDYLNSPHLQTIFRQLEIRNWLKATQIDHLYKSMSNKLPHPPSNDYNKDK